MSPDRQLVPLSEWRSWKRRLTAAFVVVCVGFSAALYSAIDQRNSQDADNSAQTERLANAGAVIVQTGCKATNDVARTLRDTLAKQKDLLTLKHQAGEASGETYKLANDYLTDAIAETNGSIQNCTVRAQSLRKSVATP